MILAFWFVLLQTYILLCIFLTFLCVDTVFDSTFITPTDYRPALAAVQSTTTQSISVNSLTSGAVEAVYQSPNKGRISLYLLNGNEDILIVIDARFDWEGEKNRLVLNSKRAGQPWVVPDEVHPEGFPFPCCGYVSTITVRVEMGDEDFTISANGIEIAKYPYRDGLHPPVTEFRYRFEDTGASKKAQLESLSAYY